jgi:hypothetical protein
MFPKPRLTLLACALGACSSTSSDPLSAFKETVGVYLLLEADQAATPRLRFYGAVLSLESALSSRFAAVTRFEMRRRRDGRQFGTSIVAPTGPARFTYRRTGFDTTGNLAVLPTSTPSALGLDSLAPGEAVDFEVQVNGQVITGSTTLPVAPTLRISAISGLSVDWDRTAGAYGYVMSTVLGSGSVFRHTSVNIPEVGGFSLRGTPVGIAALDSNYYEFLRDEALSCVGLKGAAVGLVGAVTIARDTFPP